MALDLGLCGICQKFTRANLTEITQDDGPFSSKWGTVQYWLVSDSMSEEGGKIEKKLRSSISLVMQRIHSTPSRDTDPPCQIQGAVKPLLYHTEKRLLQTRHVCRLCRQMARPLPLGDSHYYDDSIHGILILEMRDEWPWNSYGVQEQWCATLHCLFVEADGSLRNQYELKYRVDLGFSKKEQAIHLDKAPRAWLREETLARIKEWAVGCESNRGHENCHMSLSTVKPDAVYVPTRLVEISMKEGNPVIRLRERRDLGQKAAKYATLSYCWGNISRQWKLTRQNIESSLSHIPFQQLPLTIRDTIRVLTALGIYYLWVDAICIIQDDSADWHREAPQMASVYSNACLGIAATASTSSDQGLFVQENSRIREALDISWEPSPYPRGFWGIRSQDYFEAVLQSPLNRRGWVFQEGLLAPRTVHFGEDQIWWSCRWSYHNEITSTPSDHLGRPNFLSFKQREWRDLIATFSETNLTFESDRLVSFSGVAEAFALRHDLSGEDYAAGLWIPDLKDQLLWHNVDEITPGRQRPGYTYPPVWHKNEKAIPDRVSKTYVAPSWSWASIDARHQFFVSADSFSQAQWHPNFEILNVVTEKSSVSPFGSLKTGHLDLGCLIHPAVIHSPSILDKQTMEVGGCIYVYRHFDAKPEQPQSKNGKTPDQVEEVTAVNLHFDTKETVSCSGTLRVFLVPVVKRIPRRRSMIYQDTIACLILTPVQGQTGFFRRIGMAMIGSTTGFNVGPAWWREGGSLNDKMYLKQRDSVGYKIRVI